MRLVIALVVGWWWMVMPAAAEEVVAVVGATEIVLPVPEGFVEPTQVSPSARQFAERITPDLNRLLALFVRPPSASDDGIGWTRYYMVQTLRAAEQLTVTAEQFDTVRGYLRDQSQTLMDNLEGYIADQAERSSEEIGRDYGIEDLDLKVGELKVIEVFNDTAEAISLLALSRIKVNVGGQSSETPVCNGITALRLRNKIIYFFAYSQFDSGKDLKWVREVSLEWIGRALSANP
ncbi:MAG: hypothetical protein FJY37_07090 [Betaproteobacteria bacterium]|nr:hypothetical protein [Betaproteobacteria bacterium]